MESLDKEWEEEEEDGEWEEEEEEEWSEEEEEEEDEAWDEEKQAWADCLEQQGIPHKVYKPFLRVADNLNTLIERLNGLNGCERLVKALHADQRRRFLLKVAAAKDQLVLLGPNLDVRLKNMPEVEAMRLCVCVCVCVCARARVFGGMVVRFHVRIL